MAQGAIQELQQELPRSGFRVLTEESVASSLGLEVAKRSSKRSLIELLGLSGDESVRVEAGVLVRILASMRQLSRRIIVSVMLEFEVYEARSRMLLATHHVPAEEFPIPNSCAASAQCVQEAEGDRAREMVGSEAAVLARKLAQYAPPR